MMEIAQCAKIRDFLYGDISKCILCFLTNMAVDLSLTVSLNLLINKLFEFKSTFQATCMPFSTYFFGHRTSIFMLEVNLIVKYSIHNSIGWSFQGVTYIKLTNKSRILVLGYFITISLWTPRCLNIPIFRQYQYWARDSKLSR